MKTLASLVRLHRLRLDERRKILSELEGQRDGLVRRQVGLEKEFVSEKQAAQASLDASTTFQAYLAAFENRRDRLAVDLVEAGKRIEAAHDAVTESFRDMKKYETVMANRKERARKEMERRQVIEQDEIGLQIFRRRDGR